MHYIRTEDGLVHQGYLYKLTEDYVKTCCNWKQEWFLASDVEILEEIQIVTCLTCLARR